MREVIWQQLSTNQQEQLLQRSAFNNDKVLSTSVADIIQQVRNQGDQALYHFTSKLDKVELQELKVTAQEYQQALDSLSKEDQQAIETASANIRHYHEISAPKPFEFTKNGISLGKIYRPIEKVGLYIPGGSAPLVSTLLMLAIPASIAGCPSKIVVTPPKRDGLIDPAILFAASVCGIDAIYKVGGAQAIAALAFGTETIPKVHKIFGPGNKYVTAAKLQVSYHHNGAAIDMPAGPSEVLVIADERANPDFVASDLLAQAEHDSAAQTILITTSTHIALKVKQELQRQISYLSRSNIIQQALNNSALIIASDLNEAFNISNRYAPEHLILQIENAPDYLAKITNAGSVFIGAWTPEAIGDYASGTNHVLPTCGYAQMYSGLDVIAFMKAISYQKLSASAICKLGPIVTRLADLEGLDAHKNAVNVRLNYLNGNK
jgi:histidinol dehydrogenase